MDKSKAWLLAALIAVPLVLPTALGSTLNYARELEEMEMIRTMGVDAQGTDFTLSMAAGARSDAQPKNSGMLLTGTGALLGRTALEIQTQTDKYVFYGCIGQYLIGENAAAVRLLDIFDYLIMEQEMRLGTKLYVVRAGTAGEAMAALTSDGQIVSDRLEDMGKNEGLLSFGGAYSLREVLTQLGRSGAALCQAVQHGERNGRPTLEAAGYAILSKDGLLGYLTGDAACGASLLLGKTKRDSVTVTPADGVVGLQITGASTQVKPEFDDTGGLIRLRLIVKVEAALQEVQGKLEISSRETIEELETLLVNTERARCEGVVALSQRYGADFLELGVRLGLAAPLHYGTLRETWQADFPDLRIDVEVDARVSRIVGAGQMEAKGA